MSLVRRGDLTAFEVLYDRHAHELLSFCSYILGSRHDAEDAVQSTFASAYRALMADERHVELRPWLFSIARNASLSILRKRQPTAEMHDVTVTGEDPAAQVEQRESLRQMVATMLDLPERQRTALVLAELHGLSHGEIATVLGVPAKNVKAYIYQARSSLISERMARGVDCAEIRQELSAARGAMLLKGRLRRHLRSCEGCRDYAAALSRQRGQLGVLLPLPLAPSLALKRRVLDAAAGNATGAGACLGGATVGVSVVGTTAELAGTGVKALVAKLLIGVVGVGAGTGAGTLALGAAEKPSPDAASHARLAAASLGAHGTAARDPYTGSASTGSSSTPPGDGAQKTTGDRRSSMGRANSSSGVGHANPANASSGRTGHGRSGEAHGKSAEANAAVGGHGKSADAHGKSAEAHGNGAAHGKSGDAHGNGVGLGGGSGARGKGAALGRGNGSGSKPLGPTVHGTGKDVVKQGAGAGNGNAAGKASGDAGSGNSSASPQAGHDAHMQAPPATSPPATTPVAGAGPSHGQGEPGGSAGEAHEAPSHPQKP